MTSTKKDPPCSPETTELERRVLAHERILQSLIAYMSLAEPRFVEHLKSRFVEPMTMTRHEHDYRGVDDYAEEFIRAIMLIEQPPAPEDTRGKGQEGSIPAGAPYEKRVPMPPFTSIVQSDRIQLKIRGGIWEVRVDGVFRGNYHSKEHALAAVTLARLSLR